MHSRDKNGLTEREFLAAYASKKYPKPSVTADIAVIAENGAKRELLLVKRGAHPYLGYWALPGGFAKPDEPLEKTAARELEEETGIAGLPLEPVGLFSEPGRDPRGWVISQAYEAAVDRRLVREKAGDDAAGAAWFTIDTMETDGGITVRLTAEKDALQITVRLSEDRSGRKTVSAADGGGIGFDHALIIARALLSTGLI